MSGAAPGENPKRRLCFVITSSDFGGAESLLLRTVQLMRERPYEILVISMKSKGAIARQIETLGVRVETLEFDARAAGPNPFAFLAAFVRLRRLMKAFHPQVVQTSLFQADVAGTLAAASLGIPVRLVLLHMFLKKKWPQALSERLLAPWVTRYLTVSQHLRDFYSRRLKFPLRKMTVVRNAVDVDDIARRSQDAAPPRPGAPLLACVGRLDAQKGFDVLLRALGVLHAGGMTIFVWLVGEGPERAALEALAARLGIAAQVQFIGFQKNPVPFMALAEAVVVPSREEGLPMVVLEAMALGKPLVAADVGAVAEATNFGKAGVLVAPNDPEALARALRELLSNPPQAAAMGRSGRAWVAQEFNESRMISSLESAYNMRND